MFRKLFQGFGSQNTHCQQLDIQFWTKKAFAISDWGQRKTRSIRAMSQPNAKETLMKWKQENCKHLKALKSRRQRVVPESWSVDSHRPAKGPHKCLRSFQKRLNRRRTTCFQHFDHKKLVTGLALQRNCPGQAGTGLGQVRDRSGTGLGQVRDRCGTGAGQVRDRCGTGAGQVRDRSAQPTPNFLNFSDFCRFSCVLGICYWFCASMGFWGRLAPMTLANVHSQLRDAKIKTSDLTPTRGQRIITCDRLHSLIASDLRSRLVVQ